MAQRNGLNVDGSVETRPRQQTASVGPAGDAVGEATLEIFRENDGYTQFLWDALLALTPRELGGRILEVGCGIGNLSQILLRPPQVTFLKAIDIEAAYVERIQREITDARLSAAISTAEGFCPPEFADSKGGFDFIVCVNVLEHIEDHELVLKNFSSMLRPDGEVLLLIPAHPALFSGLDRNLSHFRRYTKRSLGEVAAAAGLEMAKVRHFNPVAAFGWWLNGKVLRKSILPSGQVGLYTKYAMPISRWVDRLNPFPIGVSLIAVLRKH